MSLDENLKRLDPTELERDAHYAEREKLMRRNNERKVRGEFHGNQHAVSAKLADTKKPTPAIAAEHGDSERTYYRRKSIGEKNARPSVF